MVENCNPSKTHRTVPCVSIMKKVVAIIFAIIFCIKLIPCNAMNSGVEMTPVDQETRVIISASLDLQYHTKDPKFNRGFHRFDIRENGEYALLFDNEASREYIVVYNENGKFQFALSWRGQRSCPSFEWDGENLILYRSGTYAILLDRYGHILEACNYYDREIYLMKYANSDEKETDEAHYQAKHPFDFVLKHPFYLGSYTKLVRETPNGEKTVLYEGSYFSVFIIIIPIFVFAAFFLIKTIVNKSGDGSGKKHKGTVF